MSFLRKYHLGFFLGNCSKIWITFNSASGHTGGSPGLVVIGGDSCPLRCEFESQCRILDFSHLFVVKTEMMCKKTEGNE